MAQSLGSSQLITLFHGLGSIYISNYYVAGYKVKHAQPPWN